MKRMITLLGLCVLTALGNAQTKEEIEAARGKVGINAVPKATLEIKPTPKNAEKDSDTNEGILIPRLSKLRVANIKDPEESTLVYIDDVSEGSSATVDHAVDTPGYYFFKEDRWVRLHDTTTPGFHTLQHGVGIPASTLGNIGDFYIDQTHKLLYGPKTDTGWGEYTSLAGASGPVGPAGGGTGNSFPIPTKTYTCGPDNINQVLRSVEGYFTCAQFVKTPEMMCYSNKVTSLSPDIQYSWLYNGLLINYDSARVPYINAAQQSPSRIGAELNCATPCSGSGYGVANWTYTITSLESPGVVAIRESGYSQYCGQIGVTVVGTAKVLISEVVNP